MSTQAINTTNPKDILGLRKPPIRLVPAALIIFVSRVMGLGAQKYGPYNWRQKDVRRTVYLEAAMRHILQALDGEDTDPESGMPHEAHAAACMGIILDAKSTGNLIDDRPTPGKASDLIKQMTEPETKPAVAPPDAPAAPQAEKPAALQLEVGKTYRQRDGAEATITRYFHGHRYPFVGRLNRDGFNRTWTQQGQWKIGEPGQPFDLVEEIIEPAPALKLEVGKKYRTKDGVVVKLTGYDVLSGSVNKYPWIGEFDGGSGYWSAAGHLYADGEYGWTLVAEIIEHDPAGAPPTNSVTSN